jgi:CHAT domain-containing protein
LLLVGKTEQAASAFGRAESLSSAFEQDWLAVAEISRAQGWLEISRAQPEAARQRFTRAQALYAKNMPTGSAYEGEALLGLGEADLLEKKAQSALRALTRAVMLLQHEAPDQLNLALSLNARARAYMQLSAEALADRDFCAAADVLQHTSRRVANDAMSESVFRGRHSDIFRDCVEAKLRLNDTQSALLRLEWSRARVFLDALVNREVDFSHHMQKESATLKQIDEAVRDRSRIERRLAASDITQVERSGLQERLRQLGVERRRALDELRRVAPEIAALEGEVVDSFKQIQDALPAHGVALEYSVGFKDTLLFVVSKDAPARVHRIAVGSLDILRRVGEFRQGILRRDLNDVERLHEQGAELFDLLMGPAVDRIDSAEMLLISPDGPLFDLPFSALWDPKRQMYLGARLPSVLSDSLTTWTHLTRRPISVRSNRRLAVADPDAAPPDVNVTPDYSRETAGLPRLPWARVEVQAVENPAPTVTDVLLGASATEFRVRQLIPKAHLLHFAVHALVDAQHPLDSALVLGPTDSTPTGDGLLHVQEVLEELHLDADLVVLSGCDTARGAAFQGEGLIGFTRAFEFAGADAVLASLWPVSDRPTADFMVQFYKYVSSGNSAAKSLQLAVHDLTLATEPLAMADTRGVRLNVQKPLMTNAHPYVWASFQLYGGAR